MPDLQTYMERVAGISPTSYSFNRHGGGKSTYQILIGDDGQRDDDGIAIHDAITEASQVYDAIREILGTTHTYPDDDESNKAKLRRTLPKADPFMQWLFADAITDMSGRGQMQKVASTPNGQLEAPAFDNVAFYPCYEFKVEFTPRPYAVVSDQQIRTGSIKWIKADGSVTDTPYAEEWRRYVDVERVPAAEYITAQTGQFVIDVANGKFPDGVAAPNGQLRMLVNQEAIRMTWYEVPYAYVDTGDPDVPSYLSQGLGCVNQYDWSVYPASTLLFQAVGIVRYTPPVPDVTQWEGDSAIFANNKLCDISFVFLFRDPELGKDIEGNVATPSDPPDPWDPAGNPDGVDFIQQAGHNLVPFAHMMSWYYAKTKISGFSDADSRPIFPSFPFQLLFSNPGVDA